MFGYVFILHLLIQLSVNLFSEEMDKICCWMDNPLEPMYTEYSTFKLDFPISLQKAKLHWDNLAYIFYNFKELHTIVQSLLKDTGRLQLMLHFLHTNTILQNIFPS